MGTFWGMGCGGLFWIERGGFGFIGGWRGRGCLLEVGGIMWLIFDGHEALNLGWNPELVDLCKRYYICKLQMAFFCRSLARFVISSSAQQPKPTTTDQFSSWARYSC